jgi:hypothetical protein
MLHCILTLTQQMAPQIPNPLFDLAGICCGHFLIPFWTFFGATAIGKAVIKVHIQVLQCVSLFWKMYYISRNID